MSIDVETIKAEVRARLNARINEHPEIPGVAFDHGDYIIEELAGDLIGFTRVNAFYDPSIGLPQDPSELDRYIATATANGWTKNNIYTYLDGTWHETNFEPGLTFAYVIAEDNYYGAYPTGWQELSIGGIDDYVTLTTDQNITGQKTFDQAIGVGTTNPQNKLHINGSSSPGLQISNGFSDGDDGLSIKLVGSLAVYKVSYTGSHIFGIETTPGVWETGLTIEDTPSHGPICNMPMVNVGDPTGGSMGAGSINAEALYVNGESVITGTFDIDDYYTKDYIDSALSGKSDTDHTHSELCAGDTVQLEVTEEGIIKLSHSWGLIPKDGELLIVEQNGDGSWPTKGFSVKSY